MSGTAGQDDTTGEVEAADAPSQDVRARFKEALDRKNAASHATAQGARNTGSVHGSETQGPGRRTFRRKSG